jgi:hypothetical protein
LNSADSRSIMKAKNLLLFFVLCCPFFFPGLSFGQLSPKSPLNQFLSDINQNTDSLALEKLYIQTDKPSYLAGDTLWFKGYVLQASLQNYSQKSGVLYLELVNDSNRLLQRIMVPVYKGMTTGYIPIDSDRPEGNYTLRAYTSWMRNFGESYVFQKQFYLGKNYGSAWLINYRTSTEKQDNQHHVKLNIQIKQFDQFPVGLREMRLSVTGEKRTLLNTRTETLADGKLLLDFELPEKTSTKNLSLNIEDLRKSQEKRKISMPLILNRPEKMDLQFLPEGGKLVSGLPARVAFKALNEQGYGVAVAGKVYNNQQQEVATFSAQHAGMGTFNFIPQDIGAYTARIKLPDGSFKDYPLPAVSQTGITLQVVNPFNTDSCIVKVRASPDIAMTSRHYYLIAMAGNIVCWGAMVDLKKEVCNYKVDKKIFPTGIVRFLLTDENHRTWNERRIYNDLGDQLNIQYNMNKASYMPRDSVALDILVTDKEGRPVSGTFSLAVTDDAQVKTDSTATSILTYLLLASDLKGHIEQPGYYQSAVGQADKWQHLDHLLLCQGWAGYDWIEAIKPIKVFSYPSEEEFLIKGKVTNMFNKPVAKSEIVLISKKPALILDTITNDKGIFTFKGIFPIDTASFFISAKNKRGKSFNVGIEVEEFKPPVFTSAPKRDLPWFVNIDTSTYLAVNKQVNLKKEQLRKTGGNMLKEVVIKTKRIIKDSKNLNGPGQADLIIDEEQLEKEGKTTLEDLLTKNLKGFGTRTSKTGLHYYSVFTSLVHLIIDGVNTDFFISDGISRYQYLKDIFQYYDAEEIKGIEVMTSGKYVMNYVSSFLDPMAHIWDHAFIEVTTRGGKGPFLKKSVGTYVYRPMAFTLPKAFYSPKYAPNSQADQTDIRSTVFWAPNIITDEHGKAKISFFAADNPGTYTFIIEGTDLQGHLGTQRRQIVIGK